MHFQEGRESSFWLVCAAQREATRLETIADIGNFQEFEESGLGALAASNAAGVDVTGRWLTRFKQPGSGIWPEPVGVSCRGERGCRPEEGRVEHGCPAEGRERSHTEGGVEAAQAG